MFSIGCGFKKSFNCQGFFFFFFLGERRLWCWNLTKAIETRTTIVFITNIYNIFRNVHLSNTRIYDTNFFFARQSTTLFASLYT